MFADVAIRLVIMMGMQLVIVVIFTVMRVSTGFSDLIANFGRNLLIVMGFRANLVGLVLWCLMITIVVVVVEFELRVELLHALLDG